MSSDVTPAVISGSPHGLPLGNVPGFRRLAVDYASSFDRVAPFFAGDPADPAAWTNAIQRVRAHPRDRAGIQHVLETQLRRREAPQEALAAVGRLGSADTVAVVTGQQAGLFGGPLFTLLKAISALKLAAQVTERHETPCVALFWIDSEDHDWDEIRRSTILDGDLGTHTASLPTTAPSDHTPAGMRRLEAPIEGALSDLEAALGATEFTAPLLESLRRAYQPGVTMAEAFGRWLDALLGSHGLIVFDASDPDAKPFVAELFARELEAPGRTSELAADAGDAMKQLGYAAQVTPQPDSVALFRLDTGRQAIKIVDGGLAWGESTGSSRALADDARAHPARYSPNVLLRPVVQDTLFPTIAYVAGPSELAYLGQLGRVYGHFGVPMPLMCQRATATLLDSGAERFLRRYRLPFESLHAQDEHTLNGLLESQLPASVERSFSDATAAIRERLASVTEAVGAVDPTLQGAAKSTLGRMEKDLGTLHGKVIQAAKRRDETIRRQFARTQALTFPDGLLQERGVGFVYFLNRYGPALIDRLMADLPVAPAQHWLLTI